MIVFGHAPAWLHVGTCGGHGHASADVAPEETVAVCPHGCQHHASAVGAAKADSQPLDSGDHHEHDSDTCVICQSLASPSGVNWHLLVSPSVEYFSQPLPVVAEPVLSATLLSIPQPRGPPVVA